jgi:hypothetical protein
MSDRRQDAASYSHLLLSFRVSQVCYIAPIYERLREHLNNEQLFLNQRRKCRESGYEN